MYIREEITATNVRPITNILTMANLSRLATASDLRKRLGSMKSLITAEWLFIFGLSILLLLLFLKVHTSNGICRYY